MSNKILDFVPNESFKFLNMCLLLSLQLINYFIFFKHNKSQKIRTTDLVVTNMSVMLVLAYFTNSQTYPMQKWVLCLVV